MFLFVILGATALAAALGVILSRRPVYSALFLLLNFATLAALYIMLQAQFLAAVQVIVYAGAIVVLFLFVVMLVGGDAVSDAAQAVARSRVPRIVGIVLAVLLIALLGYGLVRAVLPQPLPSASAAAFGQGSVEAIGAALYTTYLLPFELVSVLLLVGMIGAVVLARREP